MACCLITNIFTGPMIMSENHGNGIGEKSGLSETTEIFFPTRMLRGSEKNQMQKLNVKLIDAYIYHYGWVKDPRLCKRKFNNWYKFYRDDSWINNHVVHRIRNLITET